MARKPSTGESGSSGETAEAATEDTRPGAVDQATDPDADEDNDRAPEAPDTERAADAAPGTAEEETARQGDDASRSEADEAPEDGADGDRMPEVSEPVSGEAAPAEPSAEPPAEPPADAGEEMAVGEESGGEESGGEATGNNATAAAVEEERTPAPPRPAAPPAAAPGERAAPGGRAGFLAFLLGGLVAAAIGFGARHYIAGTESTALEQQLAALRQQTTATLAEQADRLAAIEARIIGAEAPDLGAIEGELAEVKGGLATLGERLSRTERALSDLAGRVASLEARPLTENASQAAVEAYEAELRKLQEAMAAQRAEIEAMMAEATKARSEAEATAQATLRRAALSRILTALDAGGGYAAALADLEATGVDVPEILSRNAETGVATLAELQAEFPEVARAALAAAREAELKSGQGDGLKAFLLKQLGVRSLKPREGNDPDAVLSRAEAAVRDGRLADALAEIDTLPDAAKAELAGWVEKARQRLAAVNAAQALSDQLN